MSDLVQVTVVGRLTRDAELRHAGDQPVLGFRLAATPYKSEALFFDVSVWGRRGEALQQYLTKGQQVVVVGGLSQEAFEHKGETRTALRINANEVALVGSRDAGSDDAGDDDSGDAAEGDNDPIKW